MVVLTDLAEDFGKVRAAFDQDWADCSQVNLGAGHVAPHKQFGELRELRIVHARFNCRSECFELTLGPHHPHHMASLDGVWNHLAHLLRAVAAHVEDVLDHSHHRSDPHSTPSQKKYRIATEVEVMDTCICFGVCVSVGLCRL